MNESKVEKMHKKLAYGSSQGKHKEEVKTYHNPFIYHLFIYLPFIRYLLISLFWEMNIALRLINIMKH